MRHTISAFIILPILCTSALAQDARSSEKFATCTVVQVTSTIIRTKVPIKAFAGCDTGGGGLKSCVATVTATQPNYALDLSDEQYFCTPLNGDNPCAFVRPGPLISLSDRQAQRGFTTNSDRVTMTQTIGQQSVEKTYQETEIQKNMTIFVGRQFTVKRLKTADSVRLECRTTAGEDIIAPISGPTDIGDHLKFIRTDVGEPYDLYTYEVKK
jgi:hypothetical protein